MRILFALAGLHRVQRGAEIAFLSVATELAKAGEDVTLIGSGPSLEDRPYRYIEASAIPRERFERFPRFPMLRNETAWEEATFAVSLLRVYRPGDYDLTATCGFPFTNLALRRPVLGGTRPAHIFVTQNGDWPAVAGNSEYRLFGCDGLVCINPDYEARNKDKYRTALIPNGADLGKFHPGPAERERFGITPGRPTILMVSAHIASKNVDEGVRAVAGLPDADLLVAGDGPQREQIKRLADEIMPGRYRPITISSAEMPALYRSVDAFLHLSRDESFGNVYVEALATGLPIVAYDLPRTRWILGDEAFYAGDDTRDVSARLDEAISSTHGVDSRVNRAERYAWPAIATRYCDFFKQVLKNERP